MDMKEYYQSHMLNMIVECVEESSDRFRSEWDYISTLQTLKMLIEKFALDELLEVYDFNEYEYKRYFEIYTKEYDIDLHKKIIQEFKDKEKSYAN